MSRISKPTKKNKGDSSEEVKKALKIQGEDIINSSKGDRISTGVTRVGRTLETNMRTSKKTSRRKTLRYLMRNEVRTGRTFSC